MLNAKANQFSLSPEGMILWQSKPENPLPGEPVARVVKGEHALRPGLEVLDNPLTDGIDRESLKNTLTLWLNTHIGNVLEPLVFLGIQQGAADSDPVQAICKTLYDSLGIAPREVLEDEISKLDAEQRAVVRSKKIKLGPILVFIPLLNKPAAVRLRGLLWSIDRERPLPAPVPADGIVSMAIDEASADRDFFRAVGYPLYAGRAVRIDMLDRVINSIYDQAEKGKFSAKHQMAEWLGCSIESLYKILEAMGHVKIYDPAEDPAKQVSLEPAQAEAVPEPETSSEPQVSVPASEQPTEATTTVETKPELAVFRLKRGKAFATGRPNDKRRPFVRKNEGAESKAQDDEHEGRKHDNRSRDFSGEKGGRSPGRSNEKFSSDRKNKKKSGGKDFRRDKDSDRADDQREARVISFEVKRKDEDSPFAILQKLKAKADE